MRSVGAALLCLVVASPSMAVADAKPISKFEARQLSPEGTKRRVLEQLSDILTEAPRPRGGRPPTRPLADLQYDTRPRSSHFPGLCAYDTVVVHFRPVGPTRRADTLVRANAVSAHTSYRFIRHPSEAEAAEQPADLADDAACAGLDIRKAYFFRSGSEHVALEGGLRLEKMLSMLGKPGVPPFDMRCDTAKLSSEACRRDLAGRTFDRVSDIEPCESDIGDGPGAACWRYSTAGPEGTYDLEIHGPYGPVEITRVVVKATIVLWHERVD